MRRRGAGAAAAVAIVSALSLHGAAEAQDIAAGERVFLQCRACHQVGPTAKNALGPELNGLFGRKAGAVEGYDYSNATKSAGLIWSEATFRAYIHDPKAMIPGSKMVFAGIRDDAKIDALVAFLRQFAADGTKTP